MDIRPPVRRLRSIAVAPLRHYFDPRFDAIGERLDRLERSERAREALARVDVAQHNAGRSAPTFDRVVSQVVSARQFSHPDFARLSRLVRSNDAADPHWERTGLHRKLWEHVYVLKAAEQHHLLRQDCRAVGFGVGREPIPAALAGQGVSVLATDLEGSDDHSEAWVETGQHLSGLDALANPAVVDNDVLARHVTVRYVDMNAVPDDIGVFDLVWSCCALEHLGTPDLGLAFLLRTLDLLRPGGISVHTTELELTPRHETADYGHLAVYRVDDLDRLADEVRRRGFEIETNWHVSMETSADRWISVPPYESPDHLKLTIGDSVSTSVGLLVRRPEGSRASSSA